MDSTCIYCDLHITWVGIGEDNASIWKDEDLYMPHVCTENAVQPYRHKPMIEYGVREEKRLRARKVVGR